MTAEPTGVVPDQREMMHHIEWLCEGSWHPHRYEIAWGRPDSGPVHAGTFSIDDFFGGSSVAMDANIAGNNVYVGMTMKRYGTPPSGRTGSEHALLATCMVLDFDRDARAGIARVKPVLRAPLLVITGSVPEFRVQLGIRLVPTQDLDRWSRLIKSCAQFSGADTGALGANRLVRLAGTISYPSTAKSARGYIPERTQMLKRSYHRYTLDEIEEAIPFPPAPSLSRALTERSERGSLALTQANAMNVVSALQALLPSFADDYSKWLEVGFALHDFDSGRVGLALWTNFSHRSPLKAATTDFARIWANFHSSGAGPRISIASLFHHAKEEGWHPPHRWDRTNGALA